VADAVAWDLAARVAARVGGRPPVTSIAVQDRLEADFAELTAEAEGLVTAATGLRSFAGPARARVTDRAGWVNANIASFRRLLAPLLTRVESRLEETNATPFGRVVGPVGRVVTATQIGSLLGWMSTRVIGQYDLLLMEDDRPEDQDIVYYVGPNVLGLERRFAFPPREFRLWVALHELTHRAQFTGVPWMREHFLSLVESSVSAADPDPKRFVEAIKKAIDLARAGRNPLDDGLMALIATPEQAEALEKVQGLMSLLEGHGDVTMDRAATHRIPSAERFSEVLRQRRQQASVPVKLLQQIIGLDAKMRQYEEGEKFIAAVEASGGPALLSRVWEAPERLPAVGEIREPVRWIDRMRRTPSTGWQPGLAVS
jgi:coenzyme F420 biosynthesis associated uncharacterized protein